jgi:hypothetical protein
VIQPKPNEMKRSAIIELKKTENQKDENAQRLASVLDRVTDYDTHILLFTLTLKSYFWEAK